MGATICDGADLPELVVVPPGRFRMGSPDDEAGRDDNEGPCHPVTIGYRFAIGRHPVTFAQWDAFGAAGGTDHRPSDEGWGRGDRPVINVGWHDAQAYVRWLTEVTGRRYRLPSEAEWEYAARAGTAGAYHWGDDAGRRMANCLEHDGDWGRARTSPVGRFPANPFGLHDMLGNVWEWVEDCWNEFYIAAPDDGSPWLAGQTDARVLRGGSCLDPPRLVRAAARNRNGMDFRCNDYGFRVAADVAD